MDMLPQLAAGTASAGQALNLPFSELPKEQQIDLLAKQMLRQQQLIAMQQMRIDSLIAIQDNVETQGTRLQELAVATNRLAEDDIAATKEALAASKLKNEAKEARIAQLEELLASQQAAYTDSQAAARQALATQAKVIETIKEENGILAKAFDTMKRVTHDIYITPTNEWRLSAATEQRDYVLHLTRQNYHALAAQVTETRAQLQHNIQNQAAEAQNIGDQ